MNGGMFIVYVNNASRSKTIYLFLPIKRQSHLNENTL